MILVNGYQQDTISVLDRGLLYGDGLFETIAAKNGHMPLWDRHVQRLLYGCERLMMPAPDVTKLKSEADWLAGHAPQQIIKIIITRGEGGHGYGLPEHQHPVRIVLTRKWPDYPNEIYEKGVSIKICEHGLGINPALAGIKHLNRIEQVLARNELKDTGYFEGLLQNTNGHLIEGTVTNLFIVKQGRMYTPELSGCGVSGVMRELVIESASDNGLECNVSPITRQELESADEIFLTNSLAGVVPVTNVEKQSFSIGDTTRKIQTIIKKQIE